MTSLLSDLLGLKEFASCYNGNGNCSKCPINEIGGSCKDNGKMLIKDVCDKLIPLLKQGRLIKLPCKVGDTVYVVKSDDVKAYTVNHFTIKKGVANVCDFGETVFLTREEAEAALSVPDTNVGNKGTGIDEIKEQKIARQIERINREKET